MVLNTTLLNAQHYKVGIKGKQSNPGKEVAPSPTPQCCSYWKGRLITIYIYIYIYIYIHTHFVDVVWCDGYHHR